MCACICRPMYVTNVCKNISIISVSSSLQNEKCQMCVYDCVRACVCVCVRMANRCTHMFNSLGSEGVKIKMG